MAPRIEFHRYVLTASEDARADRSDEEAMSQPDLFSGIDPPKSVTEGPYPRPEPLRAPKFGGETYDAAKDGERLYTQLQAVEMLMRTNRRWWTLAELTRAVRSLTKKHATEASVSARIRDLRKREFGGHYIEDRRTDGGLWEWRWLR